MMVVIASSPVDLNSIYLQTHKLSLGMANNHRLYPTSKYIDACQCRICGKEGRWTHDKNLFCGSKCIAHYNKHLLVGEDKDFPEITWPLNENYAMEYEFEKLIGEGQFGAVDKVRKNGEYYAVKRLMQNDDASKEVAISSALSSSPNCQKHIVCYKEHFEIFSPSRKLTQRAIVYNLIDGENMTDYMQRDLDQKEELPILFKQALQTLQYIHDQGVVWVDIHPGNMMIRNKDIVFLDFGNSCFSPCTEPQPQLAGYAPPERFEDSPPPPNFFSDTFSLGVVFGAVVLGKEPQYVRMRRDYTTARAAAYFNELLFDQDFVWPLELIAGRKQWVKVILDMLELDVSERKFPAEHYEKLQRILN